MGLEDELGNAFDAGVAAGPQMCMFPEAGPYSNTAKSLGRPIPREIQVDGGRYVLDYDGNFFAGYRWEPNESDQSH